MIGVGDQRDLRCEGPGEPEKPFTTEWERLGIAFENDVCDHPHYPARVNAEGYPFRGVAAAPGFASARDGDLSLLENSPCRRAGVTPALELPGKRFRMLRGPLNVGAMDGGADAKPYGPLALGCPRGKLPEDYEERSEA